MPMTKRLIILRIDECSNVPAGQSFKSISIVPISCLWEAGCHIGGKGVSLNIFISPRGYMMARWNCLYCGEDLKAGHFHMTLGPINSKSRKTGS